MNMKHWVFAAAVASAGSGATAQDVAVGLGVTNFGVALHGEYQLRPNLNARAMVMGGFDFDDSFTEEYYAVDGKVELGGFAILADYYPVAGLWRVSGGIFFSNSEVTGDFTSATNADFTGTLALKNDVSPLVTTGFKTNLTNRLSIYSDIGVIISPLEASSDSTDPTVQTDIATLNSDLKDVPVVPFIGFGVTYSF